MDDQAKAPLTPEGQLLAAAMQGDIITLQAALEAGASPNTRQPLTLAGWTVLCCAVLSGKSEVVELLLSAGAEVNDQCLDGTTALHKACLWGHVTITASLLAHGADPAIKDQEGWTPWQLAVEQENQELLRLLAVAETGQPLTERPS